MLILSNININTQLVESPSKIIHVHCTSWSAFFLENIFILIQLQLHAKRIVQVIVMMEGILFEFQKDDILENMFDSPELVHTV